MEPICATSTLQLDKSDKYLLQYNKMTGSTILYFTNVTSQLHFCMYYNYIYIPT